VPIEKSEFIWFNGKFVKWNKAKTHVLDHGLHYGTGVFEGIRAYKTLDGASAIFRLEDHVERLFRSAQALKILIPYNKSDSKNIIINTIKKNMLKECYIRPLVWCGFKELGLHAVGMPINFMVAVWKWDRYLGKGGVRTKISTWIRNNPNSFPSQAKICGGYVNSVLAVLESRASGYDEAIFLDHRGFVSEGPGENIFLVNQGKIYTPPIEASILNGITRDTVITFTQKKGYDVIETNITRNQLYNAEEAFFTGTAAEITPIYEVDDVKIGKGETGSVTKWIQEEYLSIVRGERQQYNYWLTKI
jgi:branched-chain amino acid aminotransferase